MGQLFDSNYEIFVAGREATKKKKPNQSINQRIMQHAH
jgi:3-keto-L-gulonate-6-phosphate decarboxylase